MTTSTANLPNELQFQGDNLYEAINCIGDDWDLHDLEDLLDIVGTRGTAEERAISAILEVEGLVHDTQDLQLHDVQAADASAVVRAWSDDELFLDDVDIAHDVMGENGDADVPQDEEMMDDVDVAAVVVPSPLQAAQGIASHDVVLAVNVGNTVVPPPQVEEVVMAAPAPVQSILHVQQPPRHLAARDVNEEEVLMFSLHHPSVVNFNPVEILVQREVLEGYTIPKSKNIVGFRCHFCKHQSRENRPKVSNFVPHSTSGIYRGYCRFQQKHLIRCTRIPLDIRETVARHKAMGSLRNNEAGWGESARRIGLRDSPTKGIIYCPELAA